MDLEILVGLVIALTQVGKSWLQSWFSSLEWKPWMSVLLSFFISGGVVLYKANEAGIPTNLELLWIVLVVFAMANGAKKVINALKSKPR